MEITREKILEAKKLLKAYEAQKNAEKRARHCTLPCTALEQKFKRCHTKEFLDEMSKLRGETLSLDALKEMDKIKDPHELSKALNAYKKRQNFVKKKLAQMEEEFAYWTPENIEKNSNEIGAIDLKIRQCEQAIMFVPKWP